MRVKVTQSWCLGGGVDVPIGAVIDLPEHLARAKVSLGCAQFLKAEEESSEVSPLKTTEGPVFLASQDPAPINRDPMPRGRRRSPAEE
jgi:hypothetical protein